MTYERRHLDSILDFHNPCKGCKFNLLLLLLFWCYFVCVREKGKREKDGVEVDWMESCFTLRFSL